MYGRLNLHTAQMNVDEKWWILNLHLKIPILFDDNFQESFIFDAFINACCIHVYAKFPNARTQLSFHILPSSTCLVCGHCVKLNNCLKSDNNPATVNQISAAKCNFDITKHSIVWMYAIFSGCFHRTDFRLFWSFTHHNSLHSFCTRHEIIQYCFGLLMQKYNDSVHRRDRIPCFLASAYVCECGIFTN